MEQKQLPESLRNHLGKDTATNSELTYILRWCGDAELKNKAWEVLSTQQPTNSELTYILRWCGDAELKNKAWEVLSTQQPTNSELTYILRWCGDAELKNKAWEVLRLNLGITTPVDEEALIKEIAENVLSRPGSLKMDSWHCGTSHCLAGWACVLSPIGAEVESKESTEIAGAALLPNYAQFFFSSNEKVLDILKSKTGGKPME
jgi:hypothetical protein